MQDNPQRRNALHHNPDGGNEGLLEIALGSQQLTPIQVSSWFRHSDLFRYQPVDGDEWRGSVFDITEAWFTPSEAH